MLTRGRAAPAAAAALLPAVLLGLGNPGRGGQAQRLAAGPAAGLAAQVRAQEMPALRAIGVPAGWPVSRGRGVTVAVLDTGVGGGAPDLSGKVTTGPDYAAGVDPPGYHPPHLHGTYIASLIAGHGSGPGRSGGVIGVAPAAKVLSVRVLPDDQEPGLRLYNSSPRYDGAVGRGVRYAVRHGADVINMSLGSTTASRGLRSAIGYAISHGVVVVAAAGNSGSATSKRTPYSYPASYPGVIAVAAVGATGHRASFSDRNPSVVVSAPGVNVVGAAPAGQYLQGSGTSPASALVAGVVTLIRARYPRLRPALVAQALITSTRHRPAGGYSPGTGFGEVNAPAALRAAARLAARKPGHGLPASARALSAAPGPVQVVYRDTARISGYAAGSAGGLAGFVAALIAFTVLARRALRDRRRYRTAGVGAASYPPSPYPPSPGVGAGPGGSYWQGPGPYGQGPGPYGQGPGPYGQDRPYGQGRGLYGQDRGLYGQGRGPYGQDGGQGRGLYGQDGPYGQDGGQGRGLYGQDGPYGQDGGRDRGLYGQDGPYGQDGGRDRGPYRQDGPYGQDGGQGRGPYGQGTRPHGQESGQDRAPYGQDRGPYRQGGIPPG